MPAHQQPSIMMQATALVKSNTSLSRDEVDLVLHAIETVGGYCGRIVCTTEAVFWVHAAHKGKRALHPFHYRAKNIVTVIQSHEAKHG